MKNFKFKKIALPFLLVIFIIVFSYLNFYKGKSFVDTSIKSEVGNAIPQVVNNTNKLIDNIREEEKNISQYVSVFVLEKNYKVEFQEGDTVFDIMQKLKNGNKGFDFKYKEYPSLGVFVNEINGLDDKSGKYWIYSVNKKEAEVGISKYKLVSGDIISWSQK